ncbi:MAG: prepilin peptidase [Nitrospirae bacterium]|nr:prepilin peptidase [Nitrospirota bacterium]
MLEAAAFLFGAIIGSFLNVCIYRLPRSQSLVAPGSHCPSCQLPIRWYDNIPLLSFLRLRGRCRACGASISRRYPLVELLNAAGYAWIAHRFGLGAEGAIYLALYSALLVVTFVDLEHQIVPDRITLPGIALGLLLGSTLLPVGWQASFAGALLGGGLFYLIAVVSRGGMWGGEVKLIAMIGAFLGWKGVLLTIFLAALVGSVVGIFLMVFKGKGRKDPIPFGPFLALGALLTLFWGGELMSLYFALVG